MLDEYKNKYEYKVDEYSDGISLLRVLMTVVPIRLKNYIDLNCDDYEDHNHNFDDGDDDDDDDDYTYIYNVMMHRSVWSQYWVDVRRGGC